MEHEREQGKREQELKQTTEQEKGNTGKGKGKET